MAFATKPALAAAMIGAAVDAAVPASFVTGDEVYGNDVKLRTVLQERLIGYVLAVACDHRVPGPRGPLRADELTQLLPRKAWQTMSAGAGAKGPRWYSWALVTLNPGLAGQHRLLVRRNDTSGELAYYRCYTPEPVPLARLVSVAGQRWKIEESLQTAKGQAGLDEHQVRRWCSWHRWTTLTMVAMAFLAVTTAAQTANSPTPHGLIPLTMNELRRLFDALILGATATPQHILNWSHWRRKHQATARWHHYRRRSAEHEPDLRL